MGIKGFVESGVASVVAGCATHPLDPIKVRMQLHGEANPFSVAAALHAVFAFPSAAVSISLLHLGSISVGAHILRSEGPAALFSGVSAAVLRLALYSTTSMGLYEVFKTSCSTGPAGSLPLHLKIAVRLAAGGIGAAVVNPVDVAKVRMQADGRLPHNQRQNYAGVCDAIRRMVSQEGAASLWRGSSLTVNRAMIVGMWGWRWAWDACGSESGGWVVAAVVSNPVDVVKTRVINMRVEVGRRR